MNIRIRKLYKVLLLISIIFLSIGFASCYDAGSISLEEYYENFPEVWYLDDDLDWKKFSMVEMYNENTEENLFTPLLMFEQRYKFVAIKIATDSKLTGVAVYFKTNSTQKLMFEGYYSENPERDGVVLDYTGYETDMFKGTYYCTEGNISYRIELDGKGKYKLTYSVKGSEDKVYEGSYKTTIIEGGEKIFEFETNDANFFQCKLNEDGTFNVYMNYGRYPHVFTYDNGMTYGKKLFTSKMNFVSEEWDACYAESFYEAEQEDKIPESQYKTTSRYPIEKGHYILIRIVNNCFDAAKYDLKNARLVSTNVIVGQPDD